MGGVGSCVLPFILAPHWYWGMNRGQEGKARVPSLSFLYFMASGKACGIQGFYSFTKVIEGLLCTRPVICSRGEQSRVQGLWAVALLHPGHGPSEPGPWVSSGCQP